MASTVGFGTRQFAFAMKAPNSVLSAPAAGYNSTRQLANGQLAVRRSQYMAKTYDFVFEGTDADLALIRGVRDNLYGKGPWLYVDPHALNYGNMLPNVWSQPQMSVGQRGNQAMDFFSLPFAFGAPLSATLNNPNLNPLTITGLTGAPLNGACMYSASATAPVWPIGVGTRPFHQMLVPPNFATRITVWGSKNSSTSPVLYYAISAVSPTNTGPGAGTAVSPVLAGTSTTIAGNASWRVLDIWIGSGAGSSLANTEYTTFGAIDVRMALTTAPAQPTVFDQGRGPLPLAVTSQSISEDITYVGSTTSASLMQMAVNFSEVTQPW